MATYGDYVGLSAECGETLTDKKNYFVKLQTDGQFDLCDTAGEAVTGVLMSGNDTDGALSEGDVVTVALSGIVKVAVGATTNAGQLVMTDANGAATPLTGTGAYPAGRALEGGAASDVIKIQLQPVNADLN